MVSLLHVPAVGELTVSEIFQPFHEEDVPLVYLEMYPGDSLIVLDALARNSVKPEVSLDQVNVKSGSRPMAIEDA